MTQPFRPPTGIRSSVDAVGLSDDQVVSFRLQHAAIRTAFAGSVNLGGAAAPVWVDIPVCFPSPPFSPLFYSILFSLNLFYSFQAELLPGNIVLEPPVWVVEEIADPDLMDLGQ